MVGGRGWGREERRERAWDVSDESRWESVPCWKSGWECCREGVLFGERRPMVLVVWLVEGVVKTSSPTVGAGFELAVRVD